MKKLYKLLIGSFFLAQASVIGIVVADETVNNYAESSGSVVTNNYSECWRTSYKDTTEKLEECGYAKPAEPAVMEVEVVVAPTAATITGRTVEKIVIGASMLFDFDSAALTDDAKAVINERVNRIQGGAKLTSIMEVRGYTCSMGSEKYNQKLSEDRARAVAEYIIAHAPNVNSSDIKVVGMGEADPAASNDIKEGRELNRRVEIIAEGEMIKDAE